VPVPVLLHLKGRRVVVIGGGPVAAEKIGPLVADGADVVVIAPNPDERIAGDPRVTVQRRPYEGAADLDGSVLVVTATGDPDADDRVVADADAAGIVCVRSGRGTGGSATFMAAVRREALVLAVATDGSAPAVARYVRQQLDETFGPEYGDLVRLVAQLRGDAGVQAHLRQLAPAQRQAAWRSLPLADIVWMLREGRFAPATELASSCLSSYSG
jgi:precorrin-2 dehydrogenase / sirohydrochlorin ferrochelatase